MNLGDEVYILKVNFKATLNFNSSNLKTIIYLFSLEIYEIFDERIYNSHPICHKATS